MHPEQTTRELLAAAVPAAAAQLAQECGTPRRKTARLRTQHLLLGGQGLCDS